MFLEPHPEFTKGELSWTWPPMPNCKQQLVQQQTNDPFNEYTARGAHMPLMVFICDKGRTRRTQQAQNLRREKAAARGWAQDRIMASKWASSGGGAESSSSQQVNATRGGGGKPSSAYGSRSASSWSGNDTYLTNWRGQAGSYNTNWWGSSSSSKNDWNSRC